MRRHKVVMLPAVEAPETVIVHKSIFRSAVTGDDGSVDPGYLALYCVMAVVITAIPFMCIFTMVSFFVVHAALFDVQSLGIGIGSVCTGFGVAVGAVGAFRMGDKPHPGSVTTSSQSSQVVTPAGAPIAKS